MIKHKHSFRARASANGLLKLYLRLFWDGRNNETCICTGIVVSPSGWDMSTQRCKRNTFHGPRMVSAQQINRDLQKWEDASAEAFEEFSYIPSRETVYDAIMAKVDPSYHRALEQGIPIHTLMQKFTLENEVKHGWSLKTVQMYRVLESLLVSWNPSLSSNRLDTMCLAGFAQFLSRDYKASTVGKRVSQFKRVIVWAQGKNYAPRAAIETPTVKTLPKTIVFLSFEELTILSNFHGTPKTNCLRDMFLFTCYTSLRFSDMQSLMWADVQKDRFQFFSVKTGDFITIELNGRAADILSRMKRDTPGGYVFPRISEQKYNSGLKRLASAAGLNRPIHETWYQGRERKSTVKPLCEVISSHCGRRTFICLSLQLGISPLVIMKWTGHDSYESMKPYIEIVESSRKSAMDAWNGPNFPVH